MNDKRWCEFCGADDFAGPESDVKWYEMDGMELSFCDPCADLLIDDGMEMSELDIS